jgi:hypothetical protein
MDMRPLVVSSAISFAFPLPVHVKIHPQAARHDEGEGKLSAQGTGFRVSSASRFVSPQQGCQCNNLGCIRCDLPLILLSYRLEQQLLQWLEDLDIICTADTPDWSCLSSELSSGVLLAEVTAALGLPHAVGIQERPVTAAARAGNIQAVLDVLKDLPGWHGK